MWQASFGGVFRLSSPSVSKRLSTLILPRHDGGMSGLSSVLLQQVVGAEVPRLAMASDHVPGRMVGALARVCRHAEFGGFLGGRSEGSLGKQRRLKSKRLTI